MKIAIIQTHPIQHFCPQFTSYSKIKEISLKVFFETDKGLRPYFDKDFKTQLNWTGLDLSNFSHEILHDKPIEKALKEFDPEVIIIYGYTESIQKKAYRFAAKNGKKILYISDSEKHQKRSSIKEFIKKLVLTPYFSKIDYCLSVGDSNEEVYRQFGVPNHKIIRMFFPINTSLFDQLLSIKESVNREIRNQLKLNQSELIITTIGKIVPWKRQTDIIKLLALLENKGIKATAIIIGSGPDEQKLRKKTKILKTNKAIITGFVQPEKMAQYLCATDIYIHPALKEPHSLAISEAIYCGCPILISDKCGSYGPTDDVQPGKNGFVYPAGNVEKLAELVEILSSNIILRNYMGEQSSLLGRKHQALAHGDALLAAINLINSKRNSSQTYEK